MTAVDGGACLNVYIRDDSVVTSVCRVRAEFYALRRLSKGQISKDLFDEIKTEDEICRAVSRGKYLLSFGKNSKRALARKLRTKGISAESAQRAALILERDGLIDERRDAVRDAENEASRGRGKRRILMFLRSKEYDADALGAAESRLDEMDFGVLCRRVVEKKWGGAPRDAEDRKKAAAALARLGFSYSDIRDSFKAADDET